MFRKFCKYGLKGQQALSPGHRPGCLCMSEDSALKGQKHYSKEKAFALSGRFYLLRLTQGDALG